VPNAGLGGVSNGNSGQHVDVMGMSKYLHGQRSQAVGTVGPGGPGGPPMPDIPGGPGGPGGPP